MSSFICMVCGCVDNSACGGNYWTVATKEPNYADDFFNKNLACTECTPEQFADGSSNKDAGKWHNKFEKLHWSQRGTKEQLLVRSLKGNGDFVNAVEYFAKSDVHLFKGGLK